MSKLLFIVNLDSFFISHRLPIAVEAQKQGWEVHIACSISSATHELELQRCGITVHNVAFSRSGTNVFRELKTIWRLLFILRKVKPDIAHLVTIKPVLYVGILSRLFKVPGVVSAISGLGFTFVKRKGAAHKLLRLCVISLYRLALKHRNQKVIFQNEADRQKLVEHCGLPIEKTTLFPGSGVDLNYYKNMQQPKDKVVVLASRLLKDKGIVEFVETAKLIKKTRKDVCFRLIGIPDLGNPQSIPVSMFDEWKDNDDVECLGFCSDIPKQFSEASIVVLPSYYGEGIPKVLIEAAACGRPIITTDMPGCRDAIIPNVTGLLVEPKSIISLKTKLEYLLDKEELRKEMGRAGRQYAEKKFDVKKVVTLHLHEYNSLLPSYD